MAADEIEQEFLFDRPDDLAKLVVLLQFVTDYKAHKKPKDEKQQLLEYKRRGYLFIMQ